MADRDDHFVATPAQQARIDADMSIDFWYVRRHPITDELGVAKIELRWHPASGTWLLPPYRATLADMANESDFFVSEDEAREALARDEWKRKQNDEPT